jgi:hypothetical protein
LKCGETGIRTDIENRFGFLATKRYLR